MPLSTFSTSNVLKFPPNIEPHVLILIIVFLIRKLILYQVRAVVFIAQRASAFPLLGDLHRMHGSDAPIHSQYSTPIYEQVTPDIYTKYKQQKCYLKAGVACLGKGSMHFTLQYLRYNSSRFLVFYSSTSPALYVDHFVEAGQSRTVSHG